MGDIIIVNRQIISRGILIEKLHRKKLNKDNRFKIRKKGERVSKKWGVIVQIGIKRVKRYVITNI